MPIWLRLGDPRYCQVLTLYQTIRCILTETRAQLCLRLLVMGPDSSVPDLLFYSTPENKSARSGSTQVTRWCSVQRPFNANMTRDPSADGSGDIWQRRSADTVRLPLSWYRITADSFCVFAICVISWLKELLFLWLCKLPSWSHVRLSTALKTLRCLHTLLPLNAWVKFYGELIKR